MERRNAEYVSSCVKHFSFVLSPSSFCVKGPTQKILLDDIVTPYHHAKFYAVHVRRGRNAPLKDNRLLFKVPDFAFMTVLICTRQTCLLKYVLYVFILE